MNFADRLKARVQKQAAVAADAARSISNFDQMAANDDYIHHDDLRTPEVKSNSRLESSNGIDVSNGSTPPRRSSASSRLTAAQALSQATQFSSLVLPEDDDDFSDDNEDMQQQELPKKKKNPNRFMNDLDDRLARVETTKQALEIEPPAPTPTFQSPISGWLKSPVMANVISKFQTPLRNEEERKPMLTTAGPLSSRRAAQAILDDDLEDPMENHTVVTSSMLGASEQAELERIRMATKADFLSTALTKLHKNKEFAFILLTLVLGTAAYFYSRHREEIDDVT